MFQKHVLMETEISRKRSRDSSVSVVTGLSAGRPGFDYWQGQGFFLFATASSSALDPTGDPTQRVALTPEIKRPGREAKH
jgi:hypothetical protein